MRVRTHKLMGVKYNIDVEPELGSCTNPKRAEHWIKINADLNTKLGLEVLIHECLHAVDFGKKEKFVDQAGKDIADLLWRLGYRRKKNV